MNFHSALLRERSESGMGLIGSSWLEVDCRLRDAVRSVMADEVNFHDKPRTAVGLCSEEFSVFSGLSQG